MPIKVYNGTSWDQVSDGADGADSYTLPTASAGTLGGIKVGSNLSIASGVLSALVGGAQHSPFTSNGTWTKPSTGTLVIILAIGGGGGGCKTYLSNGGAGGGGGACAFMLYL